jgi:hypothetical protein
MTKIAMPPSNNPAMFIVLGIGAWWFLTQRTAKASTLTSGLRNPAGVQSPAGSPFFRTPSLAGDTLQQQAMRAAQNQNAISGLLGTVLNSRLFGGSGPLQPSLVNEAARAAVRAGDSYYTAPPPAPDSGGTGDFARMDRASYSAPDDGSLINAASRAAVRFGDPYYSTDNVVINPIGTSEPSGSDYGYSTDAVVLNPAPGTSYTTDAWEYTPAPEIDASNFDYWG